MIAYIVGVVVEIDSDSVVIDHNGMGYHIFVGQPSRFPRNEEIKIFTYQHVREDALILFGFLSQQERAFFKQLITVKGVGPKTGINILAFADSSRIIEAIDQEDLSFLKKLPGVGPKMASQMMLDLKGKFVSNSAPSVTMMPSSMFDEFSEVMTGLGFKRSEINRIRDRVLTYESEGIDIMIKEGLKLLNVRK